MKFLVMNGVNLNLTGKREKGVYGTATLDEINEKIALKQAIECLPEPEREIILLRYFKQLTQSEVGRVLGMTQVTVSRREQKALERLRAALG